MTDHPGSNPLGGLPPGYQTIPIEPASQEAAIRLCVLAQTDPEPGAGPFVRLRQRLDGPVLLGALADSVGTVHRWLEVWVQSSAGLDKSPLAATAGPSLSNDALRRRWIEHAEALAGMDPLAIFHTPAERRYPAPVALDLKQRRAVGLTDPDTGNPLALCTDEALLDRLGLPAFATSRARYLHDPQTPAESVTIYRVLGPDAPTLHDEAINARIKPVEELLTARGLTDFNVGCGLLLVRDAEGVGFEQWVEALGGRSWAGIPHGRRLLHPPPSLEGPLGPAREQPAQSVEADQAGGWLFLGRHGQAGRLLEAFHLKLRLLAGAIERVADLIQRLQRPILDLGPESFRVRLGPEGVGVPQRWSASVSLAEPGDPVPLIRQSDGVSHWASPHQRAPSIYRPESVGLSTGQSTLGRCKLRIRSVEEGGDGRFSLQGTLSTQDKLNPASYDVAWLRVPLGTAAAHEPLEVYGHLRRDGSMAQGLWRLEGVPMSLPSGLFEQLKAIEGVVLPEVDFRVLPVISAPFDLFALAVLGVRTLLVDDQTTLAVALDETLRLAARAAELAEADEMATTDQTTTDPGDALGGASPLPQRIRRLFESDETWWASLGPQRLTHHELTTSQALDMIPPQLWYETLTALVRMFPGLGPDSFCRDYGAARPGGLHRVFDQAREDLQSLVVRSRSLIVIDWRYNREVHAVLRQLESGWVH